MVRWLVAGVVTVVAFAAATVISGALVLPMIMRDGSVRWGIAGAVGVAVAALAALWGHSFATTSKNPEHTKSAVTTTTGDSGQISNKISGGTFHGPVIQGRDVSGPAVGGSVPSRTTEPDPQD